MIAIQIPEDDLRRALAGEALTVELRKKAPTIKTGRGGRPRLAIAPEEVARTRALPIDKAARELGVSRTVIVRLRRELGGGA